MAEWTMPEWMEPYLDLIAKLGGLKYRGRVEVEEEMREGLGGSIVRCVVRTLEELHELDAIGGPAPTEPVTQAAPAQTAAEAEWRERERVVGQVLATFDPEGENDELRMWARRMLGVTDGALSDPDERVLGPFVRDSDTSRAAAVRAYPRQGSQRHRILSRLYQRVLDGAGGLTRDELALTLPMSPNSVRPRVVELEAGGWITPTFTNDGGQVTRETATGARAEVLELTAQARAKLAEEHAGGLE